MLRGAPVSRGVSELAGQTVFDPVERTGDDLVTRPGNSPSGCPGNDPVPKMGGSFRRSSVDPAGTLVSVTSRELGGVQLPVYRTSIPPRSHTAALPDHDGPSRVGVVWSANVWYDSSW
jgi:hypothetical protein